MPTYRVGLMTARATDAQLLSSADIIVALSIAPHRQDRDPVPPEPEPEPLYIIVQVYTLLLIRRWRNNINSFAALAELTLLNRSYGGVLGWFSIVFDCSIWCICLIYQCLSESSG